MSYNRKTVEDVLSFRVEGYSIKELSKKFNLSVDTVSRWCSKIELNPEAKQKLANKKLLGQHKGQEVLKKIREKKQLLLEKSAQKTVDKANFKLNNQKVLCSLLYWAEGAKSKHDLLTFINSDPKMIKLFLKLLRSCFSINEKKFRVLVHLHEYHNEGKTKEFWSTVTKIPLSQFNKCFLKRNTKTRLRENYMGTVSIRYYSAEVAQELHSIYNVVADKFA